MYAQVTDMQMRFGQEELEQLAPSDSGAVDQDKVDSALSDASAEMNTYLGFGLFATAYRPESLFKNHLLRYHKVPALG